MTYRKMEISDIVKVTPMYISYYNKNEDSCWTQETVYKRLHPLLTHEDSLCFVQEEDGVITGFAVGYLQQYDDISAYNLDEIVIAQEYQNRGLGQHFIKELEARVKDVGGSLMQLQAENDDMHKHFYGKLDYQVANNFLLVSKWIGD